jgi:hypothetical protein
MNQSDHSVDHIVTRRPSHRVSSKKVKKILWEIELRMNTDRWIAVTAVQQIVVHLMTWLPSPQAEEYFIEFNNLKFIF